MTAKSALDVFVGKQVVPRRGKSPSVVTEEQLESAARLAGFDEAEVLSDSDICTCEYRDSRVRFLLDSEGVIQGVNQG